MAFSVNDSGSGAPKADINVVPLVDVLLVLLIIFMVTAPLMNLGTDVNLPDSKAKSLSTPKDRVVVSIYPDGRYALIIGEKSQFVTAEELTSQLSAIHNQNPQASVLVNGDRNASYQEFISGIDLIKEAGVTKVSLLSHPEASK